MVRSDLLSLTIPMEEFFRGIVEGIRDMAPIEGIAVLAGIAYIAFAAKGSILCWYAAMISNLLFIGIFFDAALYTKVPLRAYYLIMAFYGLYEWRKGGKGGTGAPIRTLPLPHHLIGIATCAVIGLVLANFLTGWTDASMPYLDALTTLFSVFTTWMVARKYLENWFYWIVIDSASIYLYASQELYMTSFLYGLFTAMAILGAWNWSKQYTAQRQGT